MTKIFTLSTVCLTSLLFIFFNSNAQVCPNATSTSLVVNGDFESGNVGFTSGYAYYASGSSMGQGNYTVGTNPNTYNSTYYANMTDHNLSGTGQMLIIDVNGTVGIPVWSTTISGIVANTTYFFSAWFANIERMDNGNGNLTACASCPSGVIIQNSPLMQFFVNGSSISSLIDIDDKSNNWAQYSFVWNSGTITGSVPVAIHNLMNTGNSNDVAMDDVFFGTSCAYITNLSQYGKTSAVPPIVSLCAGGGTYNLDPQLSTANGTIWKNSGGTTLSAARTYTVSSTGTYYLCYDTIPGCYRTDTISVVNTLSVNIGSDQNLCNPVSTLLTTGVAVPPCTVTWFLNGATIPGQTGANLFVNSVGNYKAVVKAPGCATATSNGVNITSSAATPTNANFCGTSTVNLSVSPTNSGKYKWWSSATATNAGSLLQRGGSSYNLAVSGTSNFVVYVQDTAAFTGSVGPTSASFASQVGYSNGSSLVAFTTGQDFSILSMQVPMGFNYIPPGGVTGTILVEIKDATGNSFSPAKTFISNPLFVPNGASNTLYTFSFTGLNILSSWGSNLTMAVSVNASSFNGYVSWYNSGSPAYPYPSSPTSTVSITGAYGAGTYGSSLDWKIQIGTSCARIPVVANSVCALSSNLINLAAYQREDKNVFSWLIQGIEYSSYVLQQSSNGSDFFDIAKFESNDELGNYSVSNLDSKFKYFRVKVTKISGGESFSNIVSVSDSDTHNGILVSVFPNPTSSGNSGKIVSSFEIKTIDIYDRTGRLVLSDQVNDSNEYQIAPILTSGLYSIRVTGEQTSKVISWLIMP